MLSKRQWILYGFCALSAAMMLGYALGQYRTVAPRLEEADVAGMPADVVVGAAPSQRVAEALSRDVPDALGYPQEKTATAPETKPEEDRIVVGVQGAVRRPGYYPMQPGDRVQQLLEAAGGLADTADLQDINLAAWLLDGTTLYIPEATVNQSEAGAWVLRGSPGAARRNLSQYTRSGWRPWWNPAYQEAWVAQHAAASASGGTVDVGGVGETQDDRIDINTASSEELQRLPGIGPVMAGNIISYREASPFQSIEEITHVSGIAERRFEAIRDQIRVGGG